jgi:hypothetical protein
VAKSKVKIDFKQKVTEYEEKITNLALRNAKQSVYLTFNFSFLSTNSNYNHSCIDFTPEHHTLLIQRLHELSQMDIVSLTASTSKHRGLEKINKFNSRDRISSIKLHPKFCSSKRTDLAGDCFWVFRLCPNNNPYPTRIIGKMIDDIFYVMFIDCDHELYAKRR